MNNEFNDIHLINPDGILQQDEWNKAVYKKYDSEPLDEDPSKEINEFTEFPEFNEIREESSHQDEENDQKQQGKEAKHFSFSTFAGTVVAAVVGIVTIVGAYAIATAGEEGNFFTRFVEKFGIRSEVHWEWSADHTNADVVKVSNGEVVTITADVVVEKTEYCATEGEAHFHAKAPAENGKFYYSEYSEIVPPKGHDFEVYSSGIDEDGTIYGDFVCKTCGEHFIVKAEDSSEEAEQEGN